MNTHADLDAEELKFLAMQASRQHLSDQALLYLKQAIQRAPLRGDLHYLMAAEHAQLGMVERAAEEMEHALALTPELHTARLQLALLHLGAARVEAALRALQPLQGLGAEMAVHHFGMGLQHLMQDRIAQCRAALEQGMALNHDNPALNGDMKKLLDALPRGEEQAAPPQSGTQQAAPSGTPSGNVWLWAYRRDVPGEQG